MPREITDQDGNTIVIPDPIVPSTGGKRFKTTTFGDDLTPEEEALNAWNALLARYKNGRATLRELLDFNGSALEGNDTWQQEYNDLIAAESQAPRTWEEIEEILRRNGYSDDEIQEVKDSLRTDGKFQGSLVLPGILSDLGYEGGEWWDVRPLSGTPCTTDDNKTGTYDADGACVADKYQENDKCPTVPNGPLDGVIKDGQCVSPDTDGSDAEKPDCTVITQENAEECDFTIDATGNLVDKDRGDEDGIAPFYTNCGGGIWVDWDTECPDVGGVPDCTLEENKDRPECQDFCSDPANANEPECVEKGIQDLIGEFGEAAVDTAQEVYDYIEGKIGEAIDDPLGVLKEILTGGVLISNEKCNNAKGSIDPDTGLERANGHTDCTTAGNPEKTGDVCWKDCVNFVGIMGIPGLPMPPGMGELATVRDLEDFLKGIGKDIGEFIEDPAGTIEGWIEGIIDKIKGVFDSTTDDASAIIDWLKGIFGASVGAWVWGQIEEEVTDTVFPNLQPYGMCPDGETPKQGPSNEGCPEPTVSCWDGTLVYKQEQCAEPPYGYCQDGTTIKSDAAGTNCPEYSEFGYCQDGTTKKQDAAGTNCAEYAEFGYCEDGTTKKEDSAGTNCSEYTPDYGMCDDGLTKKEDAEGTNCPGPEPEVNPGDPCDLEDGKTGSYQYVGDELQCLPDAPEFGFCQDGVTNKEDSAGTNCAEYAEFGYCEDGTTKKEDSAGTNCSEYTPDYGMCDDNLTKKEDAEGTNCPGPEPVVNEGDPCDLEDRGQGTYQYVGDELQCIPNPPEFGFCQDGVTEKEDTDGTNCSEYAPFGYCQDNQTKKEDASGTNCAEYAEFGYCEDGTTKKEDEAGSNCTEYAEPWENTGPTEEDCANNGKTFIPADPESQTASSCGDDIQLPWEDTGKTPEQCEAEGKLFIAGDPETQTPSSCGQCLKDKHIDYGNGCEPERGTGEDTGEGDGELTECEKNPESYECLGADEFCSRPENKDDQRCGTTVVEPPVDEGEDPCEDPAYASANPVECGVETGPSPCDQQDRVTNEDGSCGECKPGFIEDPEGFDQCIQAPPECNDCSCAEYAAANPQECGEVPTTETPEPDGGDEGGGGGGAGGGGGGGGRSMFDPFAFNITADPQLLSRSEFPITDFLAGLFTGTGGGKA